MKPCVLIIDRNDSSCSHCGQSANPYELRHKFVFGDFEDPENRGCGRLFEAVSSNYTGEEQRRAVMRMRPDLPWYGYLLRGEVSS